jgi:hypothetical protein
MHGALNAAAARSGGARVLVVGGLRRLETHYREREDAVDVDVVNENSHSIDQRLPTADGVVMVTGMVSHAAAERVRRLARKYAVPLVQTNGPGVGQVRRAVDGFAQAQSSSVGSAGPSQRR